MLFQQLLLNFLALVGQLEQNVLSPLIELDYLLVVELLQILDGFLVGLNHYKVLQQYFHFAQLCQLDINLLEPLQVVRGVAQRLLFGLQLLYSLPDLVEGDVPYLLFEVNGGADEVLAQLLLLLDYALLVVVLLGTVVVLVVRAVDAGLDFVHYKLVC